LHLQAIEATVRFAPEPIFETDRKRLAERLRQAILAELRPALPRADEEPMPAVQELVEGAEG
jgi:hypothetical protein